MKTRRIAGAALLLLVALGFAWALRRSVVLAPWPEPPRPTAEAQLDPALRESIDHTLQELAADPAAVSTRVRLGMVYEAGELYPQAVATYEQLIARVEAGGELHYRLARSLERAGRLDDAIAALYGAVERIDEPGSPHDLLVDWLLQAGRVDDAERVVENAGGVDSLPLSTARVLSAQSRFDEAETLLNETGLPAGDQARPALFLLAQVQRLSGRIDEARATAERAATADPPPTHPWDLGMFSHQVGISSLRQRARSQLERGDLQGALQSLQTLRDRPGGDDPRVASMMAQAYLQLGRADLAVVLLERTAESHPDDFSTRLNLAKAILLGVSLGAPRESLGRALAVLDEAQRLEPESAEAWSARGQVLEGAGRLDEALAAYEESWLRDERDPTARIRAARIHLARSQWSTARHLLLPVTESRGAVPSALLVRAHAEAELGNLETAQSLLSWIGERLPAEQLEPLRSRLADAE